MEFSNWTNFVCWILKLHPGCTRRSLWLQSKRMYDIKPLIKHPRKSTWTQAFIAITKMTHWNAYFVGGTIFETWWLWQMYVRLASLCQASWPEGKVKQFSKNATRKTSVTHDKYVLNSLLNRCLGTPLPVQRRLQNVKWQYLLFGFWRKLRKCFDASCCTHKKPKYVAGWVSVDLSCQRLYRISGFWEGLIGINPLIKYLTIPNIDQAC